MDHNRVILEKCTLVHFGSILVPRRGTFGIGTFGIVPKAAREILHKTTQLKSAHFQNGPLQGRFRKVHIGPFWCPKKVHFGSRKQACDIIPKEAREILPKTSQQNCISNRFGNSSVLFFTSSNSKAGKL